MLGFTLAFLMGMSLGLLGGGGSIITVPVLVYAMGMDPKISIALSLAIVGATSLLGVYWHFKSRNVNFKIAAFLGPIAMGGTFLGVKLSVFLSGQVQLVLFALIMLAASLFMFKNNKALPKTTPEKKINFLFLSLGGVILGTITGLVGVGGGFLIVPALVFLTGVRMKQAVGTSLLIISLNSLSGFAGYLNIVEIPWGFLAKFTLCSGIGIFVGTYLVRFVKQQQLKTAFAIFLLAMGAFIIFKNKEVFLA